MRNTFLLHIAILLFVCVAGCHPKNNTQKDSWGGIFPTNSEVNRDEHLSYSVYGSLIYDLTDETRMPERSWDKACLLVGHPDGVNWDAQINFNSHIQINGHSFPVAQTANNVVYFNDELGHIYEYFPEKNDTAFDCLNSYSKDEQSNNDKLTLWKHLQTKIGDSKKVYTYEVHKVIEKKVQ